MKWLNRQLAKRPGNTYNQRWGLWTTMTLKNSDGDVYLFRRRVFQTPWLALYVHDIRDGDEITHACHSHPFPFISLILRGGYMEHRMITDGDKTMISESWRNLRCGQVNVYPRGYKKIHTIEVAEPNTKTLVLAGRRKNSWGWFVEGRGLVPWAQYLVEQGRETRDARITNSGG